jgi:mannosyl-oligosaccharide alpha-1,2-mannosidase
MYERVIETANKHLFFRPMTPDQSKILLSGTAKFRKSVGDIKLDSEGQHLTCFTGGMVAIASKIFNRPQDFKIAEQLVDGCIWVYNSTVTGIMPELFRMVACEDRENCPWDRSAWQFAVNLHQPSVDSSIAPKTNEERAEQLIKQERLPPGFSEIRDRRYILRYTTRLHGFSNH